MNADTFVCGHAGWVHVGPRACEGKGESRVTEGSGLSLAWASYAADELVSFCSLLLRLQCKFLTQTGRHSSDACLCGTHVYLQQILFPLGR